MQSDDDSYESDEKSEYEIRREKNIQELEALKKKLGLVSLLWSLLLKLIMQIFVTLKYVMCCFTYRNVPVQEQ